MTFVDLGWGRTVDAGIGECVGCSVNDDFRDGSRRVDGINLALAPLAGGPGFRPGDGLRLDDGRDRGPAERAAVQVAGPDAHLQPPHNITVHTDRSWEIVTV